ncbi:papain family cysteine protease domain-containing protein [Ditylenchus destructor]|uniref:Papain family cysteine protease domain-containing protein n=1 Tax=Ditylenchus destructor TaxID=166010 RepID=A0AAD4MW08_9BILA|nr:papain family cysteine protease domain-containing protein [Ditylenchus destructor]
MFVIAFIVFVVSASLVHSDSWTIPSNSLQPSDPISGWTTLDPQEETVKDLASSAVKQFNFRASISDYYQPLVKVISARRLAVRGYVYELIVQLGVSECSRESNLHDLNECPAVGSSQNKIRVRIFVSSEGSLWPAEFVDLDAVDKTEGLLAKMASQYEKTVQADHFEQFRRFAKTYFKTYATASEAEKRFRIYQQNLHDAALLQKRDPLAQFGETVFSDLTPAEFAKSHLSNFDHSDVKLPIQNQFPEAPEEFDWRSKGVLGPAKYQGNCHDCWAFSAIAIIEANYARKTHKMMALSEQQLLDCGSGNCSLAQPNVAYSGHYIRALTELKQKQDGKVMRESDYPYEGKKGECRFNDSIAEAKVIDALSTPQDEGIMAAAVVDVGPLAVCLCSGPLQFYAGGIVRHSGNCTVDHGGVLVGYGKRNDTPVWIVRNSWGENWGPYGGYFYLYRGNNSLKLTQEQPAYVML